MNKLKMQSRDVVGGNVANIAALFPQCVTERLNKEGKPALAIDFEKLRAELSHDVIGEGEERYQFTWPDKRAASRLANEPTTMTLRPCREESVDFDNTQNLYIEGDNLDVLKVLRETYLGKVKMIYIDPPYNTGNDFVYNDDFAQGRETFEQQSGLFDEEGNQTLDPMQRNTEANGRFHTDWLNMIYPRLKVARDLLTEDGVIFISIDDNEVENLRKICDEIYGNQNFLATFIWEKRTSRENRKVFSVNHDYILAYSRNYSDFGISRGLLPYTDDILKRYSNPDNDSRGNWQSVALSVQGGHGTKSQFYKIKTPSGRIIDVPSGLCWRYTESKLAELIADNRIYFGPEGNNVPRLKVFLNEMEHGITPHTLWKSEEVSTNDSGKRELLNIFDGCALFETPKPVLLIKRLLEISDKNKSYIVLDFFSGSATTAHAVMKLNAEDGGNRKFIMVQLPELTDKKSEAYKAGYKNICEIGKERIRRAGKKIITDLGAMSSAYKKQIDILTEQIESASLFKHSPSTTQIEEKITQIKEERERIEKIIKNLDTGFRVLKLDSSNMEEVYYTPDKFDPNQLDSLVDNIKADRTSEDLLFQVMLDLGIELSAKIERKEIAGKEVFSVDEDYLLACFDKEVNETTIEEMAKLYPTHLVIRDASAANDNVLDNFDQIIAIYSNEKKITTHIL